nr:TetR/AcrR family transcriptional regulator [Pseudoclavibacter sp. 13-3]
MSALGGVGRPLDEGISQAITAAVVDITLTHGLSAVTISSVVSAAKTTRPAFYRRFTNLDEMLLIIVDSRTTAFTTSDHGSLEEDLCAIQLACVERLNDRFLRSVLPYLAYRGSSGDRSRQLSSRDFARAFRSAVRSALERSVDRGEIDEMPNADEICGILSGMLLPRAFCSHDSQDLGEVDARRSAQVAALAATLHP